MTRPGPEQGDPPSLDSWDRDSIDHIELFQQVAINDDDRHEGCLTKENSDDTKLCVVTDANGNARIAGAEVPDGVEFACKEAIYDHYEYCQKNRELTANYPAAPISSSD